MIAYGLARLGRDCEVRFTAEGEAVATLSLAFTYGRKGPDGKRPTQWVDGALWGKRAEALAPYLLKGGQVSVTLEDVHIQEFKKGDGTPATKLAGRVLAIDLASSGEPRVAPAVSAPAQARRPAAAPAGGFADMDDDIPF